MHKRRTWISFAFLFALLGVGTVHGQETIGSFSYAEIRDGGADRSSIATFGYNYEGGLVWKCEPNGLTVMFILPRAVGDGGEEMLIEYGFGGADPGNGSRWAYSESDLLAIMPAEGVAAFTRAARGAGSIVVKATDPGSGSSETYELTLDQLSAALQKLTCAST